MGLEVGWEVPKSKVKDAKMKVRSKISGTWREHHDHRNSRGRSTSSQQPVEFIVAILVNQYVFLSPLISLSALSKSIELWGVIDQHS